VLAFTIARRSSAPAITCLASCFASRMLVLVPHRIQRGRSCSWCGGSGWRRFLATQELAGLLGGARLHRMVALWPQGLAAGSGWRRAGGGGWCSWDAPAACSVLHSGLLHQQLIDIFVNPASNARCIPQEYSRVSLLSGHQEPRSRAYFVTSRADQPACPKLPPKATVTRFATLFATPFAAIGSTPGLQKVLTRGSWPANNQPRLIRVLPMPPSCTWPATPTRRFLPTADRRPFSQQAGLRA
jgi:hypothetical protein